ncbi:MAG TPA: phage protease [Opitutaceae bacterium]|nr:phage protease [Opitutaceae bacterium]
MFIAPRLPSPLAGLKELPRRVVIAKWGKNESANGSFVVGPRTAKILPALQKLLGFDTVALDFEHNTVPGTEAYKADKEPRNVAAHGAPRVIVGEGIVVDDVRWTPHGEKSIHEGLHPDLSPTIKTDDSGEVVFVHSAALCRQGAVSDLRVFSASSIFSAEQLAAFSAACASSTPHRSPSVSMDHKKLLCLLLGLDPNTPDQDIEKAAADFAKTATEVKTFSANLTGVTTRLGQLEKALAASERAALIAAATSAGKLVPHGAEVDKLDNASFKAVLDSLPADIVPLSQRTPEGLKTFTPSTAAAGLSEAESAIARQLGISETEWKK